MAKSESISLAESLAALARTHRLRRVPLDWLWDAYLKKHTEIDPLERRRSFLEALREWAQAGGCRLPQRKKDWRQDAVPALPIWIQLLAAKPEPETSSPRQNARARSWMPAMQFMANRAVVPDLVTAMAMDDYLRSHAVETLPWVPAKERSVDIFGHGHEKKLERIAEGAGWFAEGGLTLASFHCFRVPRQPVHALFPAAHPGGIIVSENEAGFHSLCRAATLGVGFGCVVFGDGSEVLRVAEFLAEKSAEIGTREIFYFGDVDRKGLEIAVGLAAKLRADRITLSPWVIAYGAVLHEFPARSDEPDQRDQLLLAWLPHSLRPLAAGVLWRNEHRAQEAFGWSPMAHHWQLDPSAGYAPKLPPKG